MKKIVIVLICLLLISCGKKEVPEGASPVCNYEPLIESVDRITNEKGECIIDKEIAEEEVSRLKKLNGELKLELINNHTTIKDCTTCTRLLTKKEKDLEDCWNNASIYNVTYTFHNNTLLNMYNNCTDKWNQTLEIWGG